MKELWNNRDKRRGLIATLLFHGILLIMFMFLGLTYLEPKPEDGVLINFGNSATGQGSEQQGAPQNQEQPQQEKANPSSSSAAPSSQEATPEPTATQDVVEAPSLEEEEKEKEEKEKEEPEKASEPSPEPETPAQEDAPTEEATEEAEAENTPPEPEPEPQPSESLQNLLDKTSSSQAGGEGNTEGEGDQGDPSGDPNSSNRSGDGGGGAGAGNYRLGGRKALQKPTPDYPCDESGRVVVKIYVNRQGQVIRSSPGERIPGGAGSTTASSCLYDQARRAAEKTSWQPDPKAPEVQIGYIIYNFSKQ